jgi:FMN-dependent NADH-azoreductase
MKKLLVINCSPLNENSNSTKLASDLINTFKSEGVEVTERSLVESLPLPNAAYVQNIFTPPEARTDQQKSDLGLSDTLINELRHTDGLIISSPMHNFSMPSNLKAWADQVIRVGETFKYTESGPLGLLEDRPTYLVITTGGTPVGGELDHLTPWLKTILNFIGITNIKLIAGEFMNEENFQKISNQITAGEVEYREL